MSSLPISPRNRPVQDHPALVGSSRAKGVSFIRLQPLSDLEVEKANTAALKANEAALNVLLRDDDGAEDVEPGSSSEEEEPSLRKPLTRMTNQRQTNSGTELPPLSPRDWANRNLRGAQASSNAPSVDSVNTEDRMPTAAMALPAALSASSLSTRVHQRALATLPLNKTKGPFHSTES